LNYPKINIRIPADFLQRFPDGDYTIGRGADPRSAAERAADPDGSIAMQALRDQADGKKAVATPRRRSSATAAE
jgi:hypothetical protein